MIITPQELQQWMDEGKPFTVVDIRPADQRKEFPLAGLNPVIAEADSIPITENESVLICQFGIVTEGLIIEQELKNAFSLLGGAQAWDEFQSEKKDLSRWSRQTVLPEIGLEGQKKLLNTTVGIVGMGGLGCPAAQSLVAGGVGKLKIIDGDKVELSNLHRQPLYGVEDIGRMKVQAAKGKLEKLNRDAIVEIVDTFFNEDNGLDFVSDIDIVVDATDNIPARLLIDRFSKEAGVPMVYGGLYRYEGQVAVLNANGSAGYGELFPEPPSGGDSCADAGVLGMLPGIIGNIQALETVKLIVGIEPNLIGRLLVYDGINHTTQTIEL
jgi:adenylyltransferase/sulfurtransferase